jgi:hypothetical protein
VSAFTDPLEDIMGSTSKPKRKKCGISFGVFCNDDGCKDQSVEGG